MNAISDNTSSIKKTWGKLASFGAWIATIAVTFLLPLPDWGDSQDQESQMRFILFCSTAVAGFMLILTFINKAKKVWIVISIISFLLLCAGFYTYSFKRESYTLPYDKSSLVVGNELKEGSQKKMDYLKTHARDGNLLMMTGGDPSAIWTVESIENNRRELILYLSLCYFLLTVFIISFMNTLILYTKNEKP